MADRDLRFLLTAEPDFREALSQTRTLERDIKKLAATARAVQGTRSGQPTGQAQSRAEAQIAAQQRIIKAEGDLRRARQAGVASTIYATTHNAELTGEYLKTAAAANRATDSLRQKTAEERKATTQGQTVIRQAQRQISLNTAIVAASGNVAQARVEERVAALRAVGANEQLIASYRESASAAAQAKTTAREVAQANATAAAAETKSLQTRFQNIRQFYRNQAQEAGKALLARRDLIAQTQREIAANNALVRAGGNSARARALQRVEALRTAGANEELIRSYQRSAAAAERARAPQTGFFRTLTTGHLTGLALVYTLGRVATAYRDLADQSVRIESRLRLVTDSQTELNRVEAEAFAIAQRTRTDRESLINLYARLSLSNAELNLTEQQRLRTTELVGKSLAISGASTHNARAAIIQFTQAMAGGIVRAEEFNSLIEHAPALLRVVSANLDQAGGSVGALRKLVVDGKLSSEEFVQALLKGGQELDRLFGQIQVSSGQQEQVFVNALSRALGEFDRAVGVSAAYRAALSGLGETVGFIGDVLTVKRMRQEAATQAEREAVEGSRAYREALAREETALKETNAALEARRKAQAALSEQLGVDPSGAIPRRSIYRADTGDRDAAAARQRAAQAGQALLKELDRRATALRKTNERQRELTKSTLADTIATLKATGGNADLIAQLEEKYAAYAREQDIADQRIRSKQDETAATEDLYQAEKTLLATQDRARQQENQIRAARQRHYDTLQEGTTTLEAEIAILQHALTTKEQAIVTEEKLLRLRLTSAAAQNGPIDAATQREIDQTIALTREKNRLVEALDEQREGLDGLQQSQQDALLTTNDLRDAFREMVTGMLRGTRDLGNIGKVLGDLGRATGAKFFEQFLFGKQKQFDAPLIGNITGLFGLSNGIIPSLFSQGGQASAQAFGAGVNSGLFGQGGGLFNSGLFNPFGSGLQVGGGLLNAPLGSFFPGTAGQYLPPGVAGPIQPGGNLFGNITGGQLLAGAGAGYLGYGLGVSLFGGAHGTGSRIGGVLGGGLGFALGGPFGAALGSFFGGGIGSLFSKPTRIGLEKKDLDDFIEDATGINSPTKESKVGRYLGPARQGPLGDIENALTAIGVAYAGQVDDGGLGTVARLRNISLAGFQRAGLSGDEGRARALQLAQATGGADLATLIGQLNQALAGGFDRGQDAFTRSEVLENVAENAGETRPTRSNQVRLRNVLSGIIDLSTEFREGVDSTGQAAQYLADEIEEALTRQGRDLTKYAGIIDQVRDGSLHAAEALTEIGGIEFTDLTLTAEELAAQIDRVTAGMEAAHQVAAAAVTQGIAQGQNRETVEANFAEALGPAIRNSIVQSFVGNLGTTLFKDLDLSEGITPGTEAAQELKTRLGDAYDTLVEMLRALDLLPEALEESTSILETENKELAQGNVHLAEELDLLKKGLALGKSQFEIELDILRARLTRAAAEDGLTAAEEAAINRRIVLLREERDLQNQATAAQEQAAQAGADRDRANATSATNLATTNEALAEENRIRAQGIALGKEQFEIELDLIRARLTRAAAEDGLTAAEEAAINRRIELLREERDILDTMNGRRTASPAQLFQAQRVAHLGRLESVGAVEAGSVNAARDAALRRELGTLDLGDDATISDLERAKTLTADIANLTVTRYQTELQQQQQLLAQARQLEALFQQTSATLAGQALTLAGAPGGLSATQRLAYLQREEGRLRDDLTGTEGQERARILADLGTNLTEQARLNAFAGDHRQQALVNRNLLELEGLRADADQHAIEASTEAEQITGAIETMKTDVVGELEQLNATETALLERITGEADPFAEGETPGGDQQPATVHLIVESDGQTFRLEDLEPGHPAYEFLRDLVESVIREQST